MVYSFVNLFKRRLQYTLKNPVESRGIGLHNGIMNHVMISPLGENTGIRFSLKHENDIVILATYQNVMNSELNTTIAQRRTIDGFLFRVSTIEHLMSALWGCGIDNALITVDGGEIPILDGSSKPWMDMLLQSNVGFQEQRYPRKFLKILRRVEVKNGDRVVSLSPCKSFKLSVSISYPTRHIGNQKIHFDAESSSFYEEVAPARTFVLKKDLVSLLKRGLIKGGSLSNAIVFAEEENSKPILNEEKLRFPDECVRHKLLDCIGDLFLAGFSILGEYRGHMPGLDLVAERNGIDLGWDSPWILVCRRFQCAM